MMDREMTVTLAHLKDSWKETMLKIKCLKH